MGHIKQIMNNASNFAYNAPKLSNFGVRTLINCRHSFHRQDTPLIFTYIEVQDEHAVQGVLVPLHACRRLISHIVTC